MFSQLFGENRQGVKKIEPIAAGVILLFFLLLLARLLFFSQKTFDHDTLWYYGLIHYFFDAMSQGVFPYWDPYDYSGQALYYNLGITRIFEIPTIGILLLNRLLNLSLVTLYHWEYILRLVLMAVGVYLCFRQTNKYRLSNLVVFASFLFSSFTFASMIQCGLLTSFSWTPWMIWFFLRLRRDFNFYNMAGFSLFTGLSVTSYQVEYVFTYFFLFLIGFLFSDRRWLAGAFGSRRNLALIGAGILIITGLSLQTLAVYIEKDNSAPVLRQMDAGAADQSYESQAGGSSSYPKDFLGLVFPPLAIKGWRGLEVGLNPDTSTGQWLKPLSECPLYIGLLPFFLAVLGLLFSREKHRLNFIILLVCIPFLAVGGRSLLGRAGALVFPILKHARNMEIFQVFFIFTLMYFVGQGTDLLIEKNKQNG